MHTATPVDTRDAGCRMQDAAKRNVNRSSPIYHLGCSIGFPQMTQIDADIYLYLNLRNLRHLCHLRAELGGRIEKRGSRIEYLAEELSQISRRGTIC